MALNDFFPDGTIIDNWFYDISVPALCELGKQYVLTQYGILDDGRVYTQKIQELIVKAALDGRRCDSGSGRHISLQFAFFRSGR